jgi:hypothetical protein
MEPIMKTSVAKLTAFHPVVFLALVMTTILLGGLNMSLRYASAHPLQAETLFATAGSNLLGNS